MRNEFAKVSDPNSFSTNPGERYHILYSPKIRQDGTIALVECGKEDIQEMIDSFRDSTDMNYIVNRLMAGDDSVLNQKVPMYGDFTEMPKSYAEALQMVIDAKENFYKLPLDVRSQFDNDYMQWFATAGSDPWLEKMSPVLPDSSPIESEVVSDES